MHSTVVEMSRRYCRQLRAAVCCHPRALRSWRIVLATVCVVILVYVVWLHLQRGTVTLTAQPILHPARDATPQQVTLLTSARVKKGASNFLGNKDQPRSTRTKAIHTSEGKSDHTSAGLPLSDASTITHSSSDTSIIMTTAETADISIASVSSLTTEKNNMVLDTESIKITPKRPIVAEGHSARLICISIQILRRNSTSAPFMTFKFPPMSPKDKRGVRLTLRPGMCYSIPGKMCLITLATFS